MAPKTAKTVMKAAKGAAAKPAKPAKKAAAKAGATKAVTKAATKAKTSIKDKLKEAKSGTKKAQAKTGAKKAVAKGKADTAARPCPAQVSLGPICWEDRLGASWAQALEKTVSDPAFLETLTAVASERAAEGTTVYPPEADVFRAFAATPLDKVRVVIVGQDPYHGPKQAMGLSFSVPREEKIPPSLRNMFKELASHEGGVAGKHGDLTSWANQGVLLLNSVLTVREGEPNSHCKLGWQLFTDAALRAVSDHSDFAVFLLWGKFAEAKAELIDGKKHSVLVSGHPSPLSFRHFQGCDHFRKTSAILLEHGRGPAIVWDQPEE